MDNRNGTVTDCLSGLMRQKVSPAAAAGWEEALSLATGATLAGYSDWRLANLKEAAGLVHYGASGTAGWLNTDGFTRMQPGLY